MSVGAAVTGKENEQSGVGEAVGGPGAGYVERNLVVDDGYSRRQGLIKPFINARVTANVDQRVHDVALLNPNAELVELVRLHCLGLVRAAYGTGLDGDAA
jgi:hypothetical protein